MARTQIPVYSINRDGFYPDAKVNGDPTNGMYFGSNQGYTWLEIDNPGTVAVQVGAVIFGNTVDEIAVTDKIVTIGAGTTAFHFGPFPKHFYNQDNLEVYVDVDPSALAGTEGTALTFAAFDLG